MVESDLLSGVSDQCGAEGSIGNEVSDFVVGLVVTSRNSSTHEYRVESIGLHDLESVAEGETEHGRSGVVMGHEMKGSRRGDESEGAKGSE